MHSDQDRDAEHGQQRKSPQHRFADPPHYHAPARFGEMLDLDEEEGPDGEREAKNPPYQIGEVELVWIDSPTDEAEHQPDAPDQKGDAPCPPVAAEPELFRCPNARGREGIDELHQKATFIKNGHSYRSPPPDSAPVPASFADVSASASPSDGPSSFCPAASGAVVSADSAAGACPAVVAAPLCRTCARTSGGMSSSRAYWLRWRARM